jgi:nucleoside-diphosphate-sugar epimerase
MRVFVTGATGFIGSHVIPELLGRGHHVLGLTRSDAGARQLEQAGVEVHRGDLEQPETLASGVAAADAVIHCAFDHNFAAFLANTAKDERNIMAMGDALAGTDKPILITSGIGIGTPRNCGPATEDVLNPLHANPRIATELAAAALIARRIDVRTIRLPQVHDTTRAGLITPLIAEARRAGAMAYVGEGTTRWASNVASRERDTTLRRKRASMRAPSPRRSAKVRDCRSARSKTRISSNISAGWRPLPHSIWSHRAPGRRRGWDGSPLVPIC